MSKTITMKVTVHYDGATAELRSVDDGGTFKGESWGQLCQRFVETKLPYPPRLFQILTSLHPGNRMSRYRFRYGDGNSTLIRPTWSENGYNSSAGVVVAGKDNDGLTLVEANVTFRPHRGAEDDANVRDDLPQLGVAAEIERWAKDRRRSTTTGNDDDDGGGDDDEKNYEVDLVIEKVGAEDLHHPNFSTTQAPFPLVPGKGRVMLVKEHAQFKGVVDEYSIEEVAGNANVDNRRGNVNDKNFFVGTESSFESRKKRKASRPGVGGALMEYKHDDGQRRRVPSGWTFPKVPLCQVYVYWHCGDGDSETPPMKSLTNLDVAFVGARATRDLRDMRRVMRVLDERARLQGMVPQTHMSESDADECYNAGESAMKELIQAAPKEIRPKKPVSSMMLSSVVKYLAYQDAKETLANL